MGDDNCRWLNDPCDLLVADAHGPLQEPRRSTDVYTREELEDLFPIADREEQLQGDSAWTRQRAWQLCWGGAGGAAAVAVGPRPRSLSRRLTAS